MEVRRVTLPRSSSPYNENQSKTISSRPVSFYDNFRENGQSSERCGSNHCHFGENRLDGVQSPTQAHFLNTTVPQNITALNIAGRHTPTRNSLRHSRMIVMTKTGAGKWNVKLANAIGDHGSPDQHCCIGHVSDDCFDLVFAVMVLYTEQRYFKR